MAKRLLRHDVLKIVHASTLRALRKITTLQLKKGGVQEKTLLGPEAEFLPMTRKEEITSCKSEKSVLTKLSGRTSRRSTMKKYSLPSPTLTNFSPTRGRT